MIRNIRELAEFVGVPSCFRGDFGRVVERAVFKNTECGCCFEWDVDGVSVAGYAEGADAECEQHRLDYPFTKLAFDQALDLADAEGCALWDEWNIDLEGVYHDEQLAENEAEIVRLKAEIAEVKQEIQDHLDEGEF